MHFSGLVDFLYCYFLVLLTHCLFFIYFLYLNPILYFISKTSVILCEGDRKKEKNLVIGNNNIYNWANLNLKVKINMQKYQEKPIALVLRDENGSKVHLIQNTKLTNKR